MKISRAYANERQFAILYVKNGRNAAAAYRLLYPRVSPKSSTVLGCRWLAKVKVQNEIARLTAKIVSEERMTINEALARMAQIARANYLDACDEHGRMLPLHKIPPHVRGAIKRIKVVRGIRYPVFYDKDRQLCNIGKYLGLW